MLYKLTRRCIWFDVPELSQHVRCRWNLGNSGARDLGSSLGKDGRSVIDHPLDRKCFTGHITEFTPRIRRSHQRCYQISLTL